MRRGHERSPGLVAQQQRVVAAADDRPVAVRRQEGGRPLRRQARHGAHGRWESLQLGSVLPDFLDLMALLM